jgi:hypothetical protein
MAQARCGGVQIEHVADKPQQQTSRGQEKTLHLEKVGVLGQCGGTLAEERLLRSTRIAEDAPPILEVSRGSLWLATRLQRRFPSGSSATLRVSPA